MKIAAHVTKNDRKFTMQPTCRSGGKKDSTDPFFYHFPFLAPQKPFSRCCATSRISLLSSACQTKFKHLGTLLYYHLRYVSYIQSHTVLFNIKILFIHTVRERMANEIQALYHYYHYNHLYYFSYMLFILVVF